MYEIDVSAKDASTCRAYFKGFIVKKRKCVCLLTEKTLSLPRFCGSSSVGRA